ncbi:MAG: S9 family peptidase [Actinobacteria bacterium]|nr:S9 family peptidase [Actinomycetota bacterium]
MTPDDLSKLVLPSDPRIEPGSGRRIAFAVSRADIESDKYHRTIWVHDDAGAREFTSGPGDANPRWSPDGARLAFLRTEEGGKPQVAVIPTDGGEARVLTDFLYGVEALEWSPDGSRLVVTAVTADEAWEDLDETERGRRPRRITRIPFRADNRGWVDDRRRHLWLVDPTGGEEPRCLTPGEYDEESPAWSPDGKKIAFISDRDPGRGLTPGVDVLEVDVETGEQNPAVPHGYWAHLSYGPDGRLHLLGQPSVDYPLAFFLQRRESDGSLTELTGHLDRGSVSLAAGQPFIRWQGGSALVGLEDSGRFGVIRVDPDGTVTRLVDEECMVLGLDCDDTRIVCVVSHPTRPGELYAVDAGALARLTELNPTDLDIVETEHFSVSADGQDLDVWVILPTGEERVPLLLNIHGGPASQYGFGFFDEFQIYAAAGYGVVACNPRGSSGRGQDFLRAVTGEGWGTVDMADVDVVVAEAQARHPRLDADRMGIMGGSYGGFLTAWVIAHEDRWRSAVVERALVNWASFAGTSDIGGSFPYLYTKAAYPDAWETWWRLSPLAHAHKVKTPTLIIHSEDDFRCPIEQGEQYLMALLRNGTPAEMVRFPGESHELSRSGKPRHRKERFEAILDWHARHLASRES